MQDSIVDSVDQQWLLAHQVGYTAFRVSANIRQGRDADGDISLLVDEAQEGGFEPEVLLRFPPSVLHLVLDMFASAENHLPSSLDAVRSIVESTLAGLRWTEDGQFSPLNMAEIVAHNIINTQVSARRLLRLARSLMPAKSWQRSQWRALERNEDLLNALPRPLARLRDPSLSTESRLEAVAHASELIAGGGPYWAQVQNALYHQFVCWPLLVAEGDAISLPVIVDVRFDGGGKTDVAWDAEEGNEDDFRETRRRFGISAEKAVTAARALWYVKHRRHSREYKEAVRLADVSFHLGLVQEIVGNRPITGESAEAYFAQVILSRFLRSPSLGLSSGASGQIATATSVTIPEDVEEFTQQYLVGQGFGNNVIGTQEDEAAIGPRDIKIVWKGPLGWQCGHKGPRVGAREASRYRRRLQQISENGQYQDAVSRLFRPGGPFLVLEPSGVPNKLDFAFRSQFFERIVLPFGSESEYVGAIQHGTHPTAETIYVSRLDHMADVMQVGGWRQYRYVRCPDIMWGLHEEYHEDRPGLLAESRPEVDEVRRRLPSDQPVLAIHESPQVVLSALVHMSATEQFKRALSWTCVRVIPDELDEQFWHVLWAAIGAPMADFMLFVRSREPAEAAECLARVLTESTMPNGFSPGLRSPDFVVLLGTSRFEESLARTRLMESRPLAVTRVLQELQSQRMTQRSYLQQVFGAVRIICVPEDQELTAGFSPKQRPDRFDSELLTAFSILRFGFTQQMAALMLGSLAWYQHKYPPRNQGFSVDMLELRGNDLREKLGALRQRGYLRYGQGVYHVPAPVREMLGELRSDRKRAVLHYSAAVTLAPYTAHSPVPSLAFDRAFHPENVHEAAYHLKTCFDISQRIGFPLMHFASEALVNIHRFVEPPHWASLHELLQGKRDWQTAWEQSLDLLELSEDQGNNELPSRMKLAIQAGIQYYHAINKDTHRVDEIAQLIQDLDQLFNRARAKCHTDRPQELLLVLSVWAVFLRKERHEKQDEADTVSAEIWDILGKGAEGASVQGEWFECEADREESPDKAAAMYEAGVQWVPAWNQSWFKGAGAELLATTTRERQICEKMKLEDTEKPAEAAAKMIRKATIGLQKKLDAAALKPFVRDRWQAGLHFFITLWGRTPEVRRVLEAESSLLRGIGVQLPR